MKAVLKMLEITANFLKLQYECKKHYDYPCLYFLVVELFLEFLEASFNFNLIIVSASYCKRKKTAVF